MIAFLLYNLHDSTFKFAEFEKQNLDTIPFIYQ